VRPALTVVGGSIVFRLEHQSQPSHRAPLVGAAAKIGSSD